MCWACVACLARIYYAPLHHFYNVWDSYILIHPGAKMPVLCAEILLVWTMNSGLAIAARWRYPATFKVFLHKIHKQTFHRDKLRGNQICSEFTKKYTPQKHQIRMLNVSGVFQYRSKIVVGWKLKLLLQKDLVIPHVLVGFFTTSLYPAHY